MITGEPVRVISDVEMQHWKKFCVNLFERIIEARMAGKPVDAEVVPHLRPCGIGGAQARDGDCHVVGSDVSED